MQGAVNPTLKAFNQLARLPGGKRLFIYALCLKAPYFSSIRPEVVALKPGYSEYRMKKRRAVQNHLGTVHALAMGNLCELAAGTAMEASLPARLRWIPKSMNIEYLKKAETDLTARCRVNDINDQFEGDLPVLVEVLDARGELVSRAHIHMYLSRKPERSAQSSLTARS